MTSLLTQAIPCYRSAPVGAIGDAGPQAQPAAVDLGDTDRIRHHLTLAARRRPGTSIVEVAAGATGDTEIAIVTDDMPLLVEAVLATVEAHGLSVVRIDHPVMTVTRTDDGDLTAIDEAGGGLTESWISLSALTIRSTTTDAGGLATALRTVIARVADVDEDVDDMRAQLTARAAEAAPEEAARLLAWLAGSHFVPLGYASVGGPDDRRLGIWRAGGEPAWPPLVAGRPRVSRVYLVTGIQRSNFPILVQVPAADGVSEHRFVGSFTSAGLHQAIGDVPVVRATVGEVIRAAGVDEDSFAGRSMMDLLQHYPLAGLFETDPVELGRRVAEMLDAVATRSLRVFLRVNPDGAAATALIYLPRDRYTTRIRLRLQDVVTEHLHGSALEYSARVSELPLAQLQVLVRVDPDEARSWGSVDIGTARHRALQAALAEEIRSWDERVRAFAAHAPEVAAVDGGAGAVLSLIGGLPDEYKDRRAPADAVVDLAHIAGLAAGDLAVTLRRSAEQSETFPGAALAETGTGAWDFTLYLCGGSATLTDVLPVLASLGLDVLDEHPYRFVRPDGLTCHTYEFAVTLAAGLTADPERTADLPDRFTEAFHQIWRRNAAVDAFNSLIIRCGLNWREVAMLRAYSRYLRQCGFAYSSTLVASTLGSHRAVTRGLVDVFDASFNPATADDARRARASETLAAELAAVLGLDADRILSAFSAVIAATDRTNFYVPGEISDDGASLPGRPVLSVKLRTRDIPQAPEPRPLHEIFVYSPRVEGVHLRFGSVARGGLRWSDRREDFRTEVLGLAKAQAVKNAVIVPQGAKGGFVVNRPPAPTGDAAADREALRAEGIACYRQFIAGLLDVTDNIDRAGGAVLPARSVVRRDGDDPYLVVAADKGTASFSDIANEVARSYGFWLGDGFASGGSAGYDHKAMGITARGAWESVRRHFREIGHDTQTTDFTVVGIGDMSGDVFGNGMLLSRHIRLVAAFDHRHVFVDPDPNAATGFAERTRLFGLARSSWADYDGTLISAGGGVWSRDQKSIPVSPAMRRALGLADEVTALAPPELIRAVLLAPVDLLWNGGIGTYVRASGESDAQVGDKANDAIRVTGEQLRVKVVGEGGNLGVTERGRIEFDLAGGRINTDAMDNSAGVDCSDHEVNIKILLDTAVSAGELPAAQRNPLLESMTDEVAELVLADNVAQNAELGFARAYSGERVDVHVRMLGELRARGVDLELEALPSPAALHKRVTSETGGGLTSPELATLMAHVKLAAKEDLLAGELPDNDVFDGRLAGYFPEPLRGRFGRGIHEHRLRREIVTTVLVNDMVAEAGTTHLFRLCEASGASTEEAMRAYAVAVEVFGLSGLLARIQRSAAAVAAIDEMTHYARRLLFRVSRWFLAFRPQPLAIGAEITRYAGRVEALTPSVAGWFGTGSAADVDERVAAYRALGVADDLAHDVAISLHRFCLLDIIDVAEIADRDPVEVGDLYFAVMEHFGLEELLTAVSRLDYGDRWHALARLALRDDMHGALRALTLKILDDSEPEETSAQKIAEWEGGFSSRLARLRAMLDEIEGAGNLDLATLSVAARQLRSVIR
ncbi:MAG: NAD-glutamate dehydrogenase [Gordonia sp. (in: high G+C Gram-positive bacteria)]